MAGKEDHLSRHLATAAGCECEHGLQRGRCPDCVSGVCLHGRRRYTCKECGGAGICEHDKLRTACKECVGGSICEHNKLRTSCKECGGGSICEHDTRRSECKKCGGSSICEHNTRRSECKKCGGSSICEHNKRRRQCKKCVKPGVKAKVTGSKRKRIEEDTWVACDTCNKWRMLPADAPPVGDGKWYCAMNPDDRYNACGAPEQTADES